MVLPQITIDLVEAYKTRAPLALIIAGISAYGVFVFNFYRFLAERTCSLSISSSGIQVLPKPDELPAPSATRHPTILSPAAGSVGPAWSCPTGKIRAAASTGYRGRPRRA